MQVSKFPKVSIIILNWNQWPDTVECLQSLYQINYPNFQIIVVDNASKNESVKKIKEYCYGKLKVKSEYFACDLRNKPVSILEYTEEEAKSIEKNIEDKYDLIMIKNSINHGFAEGNNIGIRYALTCLNSDYILLLNNDTVVDRDFLKEMVKVAESDEKIGVIGSKIYYYDPNNKKDTISNIGGKINLSKYPGYYDMAEVSDINNYKNIIECDWVSGAVLMMKSKQIPLNFLNNDLFFGCEDIDFCIKIKKEEYKVISVLNSCIWHKEGISREKRSSNLIKKALIEINTNLKFLKIHNKHYNLFLPIYILQIIILYLTVILKKLI